MPRKPARIVILGGGLGGLYAALTLQKELAGFIQGEVQAFGLQARTIRTENLSIPYDYLIVALSVPMLSLTTATGLTRATFLGQHSGMAEEGVQGALRPSHSRVYEWPAARRHGRTAPHSGGEAGGPCSPGWRTIRSTCAIAR